MSRLALVTRRAKPRKTRGDTRVYPSNYSPLVRGATPPGTTRGRRSLEEVMEDLHLAASSASPAAISFTVLWHLILSRKGDQDALRAQGELVSALRGAARRRGLPHIFVLHAVECGEQGNLHGHLLLQVPREFQEELLVYAERRIKAVHKRERGGNLPKIAFHRDGRWNTGKMYSAKQLIGKGMYLLKSLVAHGVNHGVEAERKLRPVKGPSVASGWGRIRKTSA
jgi:hypothetical protein